MGRPRKTTKQRAATAVAYLRVSTEEQTIQQQRDEIEVWSQRSGIRVLDWFVDEGISGAAPLTERPALMDALVALKVESAGYLVAWKRDRLARDVGSACAIERLSREAGAQVITADGVDASDTPEGQLMRTIFDALAQYELAMIRARTKVAMRSKKKRGEVVGSIPYGYAASSPKRDRGVDGKRRPIAGGQRLLVPLAHEQRGLERMRALRATGASCRAIADALTTEGYKPRGKRWHVKSVQRSLGESL